MKSLNKESQKIFDGIIDGMKRHKKIDNGAFMPLVVEKLSTYDVGTMYSFAHYFKQNGDMCQDPEMCFLKHAKTGRVYACSFQQAIPPIYQESIFFDDGWKFNPRLQKDHTDFANMWMDNIKYQQNL